VPADPGGHATDKPTRRAAAGRSLAEHRTIPWRALPGMVPTGDGSWALPEGGDRLPLTFALTATKPA